MFKLIGALIVIISTTLAGFQKAKGFIDRPRQLRQLQLALQHLETEIVYGSTPLYQAMKQISDRLKGPVSYLFAETAAGLRNGNGTSVQECWANAVHKVWGKTSLKGQEQEILLHLGNILGLTDKEDQQKHVRLAMMNLHSEEEAARVEQLKNEKMCKTLGFVGGLLIVILMY